MSLPNLSRPNIRTFSNIPFCPVFVLTAPCAVLRDVLRAQRGDAQTDRDLQETRCHHQTGPSLPLWRGELYQCQGHMYNVHAHIAHIAHVAHVAHIAHIAHIAHNAQYSDPSLFQHQQQVAVAVERAKQITMQELNAVMQVFH